MRVVSTDKEPTANPTNKVDLSSSNTLQNINKSIQILISKMAEGELNGDEIKPFSNASEAQFKAIEQANIIPRLERLKSLVTTIQQR